MPSVRENLGVLTSRAGFIARIPFSVNQENSIRIAAICCLNGSRIGERRHPTFAIRKNDCNTSRRVLEKLVDVGENRSAEKTKTNALDNNRCFDEQSFSLASVLFSTQRRRAL